MTRAEFMGELDDFFHDILTTVQKKNADYATGSDPFANFKMAEMVGVPWKRAILVRISDKLARIANCLDKGCEVDDELASNVRAPLSTTHRKGAGHEVLR